MKSTTTNLWRIVILVRRGLAQCVVLDATTSASAVLRCALWSKVKIALLCTSWVLLMRTLGRSCETLHRVCRWRRQSKCARKRAPRKRAKMGAKRGQSDQFGGGFTCVLCTWTITNGLLRTITKSRCHVGHVSWYCALFIDYVCWGYRSWLQYVGYLDVWLCCHISISNLINKYYSRNIFYFVLKFHAILSCVAAFFGKLLILAVIWFAKLYSGYHFVWPGWAGHSSPGPGNPGYKTYN